MKVAIYCRVSTIHQVDKDSLPMQKRDLINYSKLILGIDDYVIFEDAGYSAKNTDRPAFQEMINRIENNEFTHVLVWKLDRISRNIADFTNMWNIFEKYDVKFISKNDNFQTDTPMGRCMLNIVMTFAQLEREMTAQRVLATMNDRASRGLWNGSNVPFGYKFDHETKFPTPDEIEAPILKHIYDKYEEIRSTVKLAEYLNKNGYKTKRGSLWGARTVRQLLVNPFYYGTLRYNYRESARGKIKPEEEWIVVENNHEALITKEQWERVNNILKSNATSETRKIQSKNVHIFSGLIKCGICGSGGSAYLDRARSDGYRPSMYTCTTKTHGRAVCDMDGYFSDMIIGGFVLNYISNVLYVQKNGYGTSEDLEKMLLKGNDFKDVAYIKQEGLQALMEALNMDKHNTIEIKVNKESNQRNEELVKSQEKLKRALVRLDNIMLFSDDAMDEREYLTKKNELLQELNKITAEINKQNMANSKTEVYDNRLLTQAIMEWKLGSGEYINYRKFAVGLDVSYLKEFFNTVLDKVILGKNKRILAIIFKNGLRQDFLYR